MKIQSFVDSDYAGDIVYRKLMTEYLVNLGGAMIIWGGKKQTSVALLTCDAEYYALT